MQFMKREMNRTKNHRGEVTLKTQMPKGLHASSCKIQDLPNPLAIQALYVLVMVSNSGFLIHILSLLFI